METVSSSVSARTDAHTRRLEFIVTTITPTGQLARSVHRFRDFRAIAKAMQAYPELRVDDSYTSPLRMQRKWHCLLRAAEKRRVRTRLAGAYIAALLRRARNLDLPLPPELQRFLGMHTQSECDSGVAGNEASSEERIASLESLVARQRAQLRGTEESVAVLSAALNSLAGEGLVDADAQELTALPRFESTPVAKSAGSATAASPPQHSTSAPTLSRPKPPWKLPRWNSLNLSPSAVVTKMLDPLFHKGAKVTLKGVNEICIEDALVRIPMIEWLLHESLGGVVLPMHIRSCRIKSVRVDLRQLVHRKLPMRISEMTVVLSAHRRGSDETQALNEANAARAVRALLHVTGRQGPKGEVRDAPGLSRGLTADPGEAYSKLAPKRTNLGSVIRAAHAAEKAKQQSSKLSAFCRKRREVFETFSKQLLPQIDVGSVYIRHECIGKMAVPQVPVAVNISLAETLLLWLLLAYPQMTPVDVAAGAAA